MDSIINFSKKYLHARLWIPIWLTLTVFTFPLSASLQGIFLGITLIDILSLSEYRKDLLSLFSSTWFQATLALFGMSLIACLWSPASFANTEIVFNKYVKILYLPLLAIAYQNPKNRDFSFYAYLLAMLFTCSLSILKYHGFLNAFVIDPDYVFRNHIITGLLVSFAVYLSLLFCYRQQGIKRIVYGLLASLFTYQVLFINAGRTGYLLYLLFIFILVLQLLSWRQAVAAIVGVVVLFLGSYFSSPIMKSRMNDIPLQIENYQKDNKNTQIGYRLQFHKFAYQLFNQHPIRGNGTGSFGYYFGKDQTRPEGFSNLLEPHSQYWLTAAEFGSFGLVVLMSFFISLIFVSRKLNQMKPIAFAIIVAFMVGNISDSMLFYSGSGYFFILFMALCLGEWLENKKALKNNGHWAAKNQIFIPLASTE